MKEEYANPVRLRTFMDERKFTYWDVTAKLPADIKVDYFSREYSRNARLTFSYQFGNTKVKNARERRTGSESETARVKVQ